MTRTVTVGVDTSRASRAAADWAAREARLPLPLQMLHVCEPVSGTRARWSGPETKHDRSARDFAQAVAELRMSHPGVEVITDRVTGDPATALAGAADTAELLALGSHGLGGLGGFFVCSVGLNVIAHAARPVVPGRCGPSDPHRSSRYPHRACHPCCSASRCRACRRGGRARLLRHLDYGEYDRGADGLCSRRRCIRNLSREAHRRSTEPSFRRPPR
ncbi:universal stress protein [Streptomyces sp. NPDC101234]|uniref:universal stress protein n=1 Tax=Streptomyces sp. NPDC101234 TaxID=3366138 RepID=UPI0037F843AF